MDSKDKILTAAIRLFADKGFDGLSMRQLAAAVEMSVAGLYHHFPDKHALYLAATQYAFSGKAQAFAHIWDSGCPAPEKLRRFVLALLTVMADDDAFCRLVTREILAGDAQRLQFLAGTVFRGQFVLLTGLAEELAPGRDPFLVATAILNLATGYTDHLPLDLHLPGWREDYARPAVMADHITDLLLNGLSGGGHRCGPPMAGPATPHPASP